jgi:hypothetical protein
MPNNLPEKVSMKKPIEPRKPVEPQKDKEVYVDTTIPDITYSYKVDYDDYGQSATFENFTISVGEVRKLLANIDPQIDPGTTIFFSPYAVEYRVSKTVHDPKYDQKRARYLKDLERYETKKVEFEEKSKLYDAWLKTHQEENLTKEYEKAKKDLLKLEKKLRLR